MGCDIHMYVEKKVDGKWVYVDPFNLKEPKNDWDDFDNDRKWAEKYPDDENPKQEHYPWSISRNYALFTVLSGVRSDSEENVPIKPCPYAIPEDSCEFIKQKKENWGRDGHSHSYYTLKELLDYDWKRKTTERGVIKIDEAIRLKKGEDPDFLESWCGMIYSDNARVMLWDRCSYYAKKEEQAFLAKNISATDLESLRDYYTHVEMEWSVAADRYMSDFVDRFIPTLQTIGAPDEVRCVFWYDN